VLWIDQASEAPAAASTIQISRRRRKETARIPASTTGQTR
jgi:hypothetical protein